VIVDRLSEYLVTFVSWRRYTGFLYRVGVVTAAILYRNPQLIATLLARELRRTRFHRRILYLLHTVLQNVRKLAGLASPTVRGLAPGGHWPVGVGVIAEQRWQRRLYGVLRGASERVAILLFVKGRFNRRRRTLKLRLSLGEEVYTFQEREVPCRAATASAANRQGSFGLRVFFFYR
jgi:hypothetical protein